MTEVKYKAIALTLENNIKANIYNEKLPPVRSLVAEFCVGNPTMNKALKILVKKGLIIPSGPKGNIINKKDTIRPKTNVIAIFCDTGSHNPNNDPLLDELKLCAEYDGYKLLFMNTPDPNVFDDEQFWSSAWVDGYIFVYSSIKKEIAYKLHNHSVPFVVANRLPAEFGAHWVDFNLRKSLRVLVKTLIEAGRKQIMFASGGIGLSSYADYIKELCYDVLKEYSRDCSGDLLYFSGHDVKNNSLKCADAFIKHKSDALIITGLNPLIIEDKLCKIGKIYNENYSLIYRGTEIDSSFAKFPCLRPSYHKLANETWDLFKRIVECPKMEAQQILVDDDIYFDKIVTKKSKINSTSRIYSTAYAIAGV
jgi:hypothetical protein